MMGKDSRAQWWLSMLPTISPITGNEGQPLSYVVKGGCQSRVSMICRGIELYAQQAVTQRRLTDHRMPHLLLGSAHLASR